MSKNKHKNLKKITVMVLSGQNFLMYKKMLCEFCLLDV